MLGSTTQQNVTKFILCFYASRYVKPKTRREFWREVPKLSSSFYVLTYLAIAINNHKARNRSKIEVYTLNLIPEMMV